MKFDQFHNALRILRCIDMDELVEAGVLARGNFRGFETFRSNPFAWFIAAPDAAAQKVFAIIQKRQPEDLK